MLKREVVCPWNLTDGSGGRRVVRAVRVNWSNVDRPRDLVLRRAAVLGASESRQKLWDLMFLCGRAFRNAMLLRVVLYVLEVPLTKSRGQTATGGNGQKWRSQPLGNNGPTSRGRSLRKSAKK